MQYGGNAGAAVLYNEAGATCCEWQINKIEGARGLGDAGAATPALHCLSRLLDEREVDL